MEKKTYIGNGKEKVFNDGGSILKFSLSPKDIEAIKQWAVGNNGWCNINISKRKEVSDKGITHYGTLDTWKPNQKTAEQAFPRNDGIPF